MACTHVMTHRRSSTLFFSRTSSLTETFSSAGKNGSPAFTVFRTVTWHSQYACLSLADRHVSRDPLYTSAGMHEPERGQPFSGGLWTL